jgi:hypothetical protein
MRRMVGRQGVRASRVHLLLACTAVACGPCGGSSAIDVNVVVPQGMDVRCADVTAATPPASPEKAGPFDASTAGTYSVAVFPGGSLGKDVELQAHGFTGADCDALVAASDVQTSSFDGRIEAVILVLAPWCDGGCPDAATDAGGMDGSVGPDGGAAPDGGHDGGSDAGPQPGDAGADAGADAGGPDGGCTATSCGTSGLCAANGTCVPNFMCDPTNFKRTDLPPISPNVLLSCGVTQIDTGTSSTPSLTNWCGQVPGFAQVTQSDGRTALLAAMSGFVLDAGSVLVVTGAQPLILAVLGDADIAGMLFAGAEANDGGAGSSVACGSGIGGDGTTSDLAGGGGGGGGFGNNGGAGGTPAGTGGAGGSQGQSEGSSSMSPLRGGCRGGNGASNVGGFGEGGGAVQLTSAGTLSVEGTIASPGGGGTGGASGMKEGGGGGGSGGAIFLEGQSLVLGSGSALTANGGGGGGGGGSVLPGNDGSDGLTQSLASAPGGSGNRVDSGDGGNGGSQTASAASGANGIHVLQYYGGGGGGGGEVGRIRLHACGATCTVSSGAITSPTPSKDNCP